MGLTVWLQFPTACFSWGRKMEFNHQISNSPVDQGTIRPLTLQVYLLNVASKSV